MTETLRKVVATCYGSVLKDEPWQDLGFRRRPTYGAFFQRFRPRWKVALEKKVLQEMVAVFTAAHVTGGAVTVSDIPELVDAYTATSGLAQALGFTSREEARSHLREAIGRYIETPTYQWSKILLFNIDANSVPDQAVAARLILGCVEFGMNAQAMVNVIGNGRN